MNKKLIFTTVVTIITIFASDLVLFPKTAEKITNTNPKGSIIVEMTNFANNEGFVLVSLCKDFPENSQNMIMIMKSEIKDKKAMVVFKDVPYGVYAISGFHDENNDGKIAKGGFFNIPKEGIVSSNNAVGKMGPVKFKDAKFELKSSSLKQEIKVKYY